MSCIELYRGDLCHFHLLSIENIADFVMCSSIRAVRARVCVCVCVRACVCVCVWWLGMGVDKFIQNQADGGGGGGGGGEGSWPTYSPLWTNYLKNQADFNRKHRTQVTPLIFASKSTFSEYLHASIQSHHTHFKTHGPGFLSLN